MKVYEKFLDTIKKDGAMILSLIDPDETNGNKICEMVKAIDKCGSDGIMVGGSGVDIAATDRCVQQIKKETKLPVILFPGNITGISPNADAIFFMSLLNSRSNYWLSLSQALGSYSVKQFGLEVIPMGYIIVESGQKTSVEFYGDANAIPRGKPKIAAAFSLAAQYMGMKIVYLEAGSRALMPVSDEMIKVVKSAIDIPLIVGGGIKDGSIAYEKVKAGADIIVVSSAIESATNMEEKLKDIIGGVKKAGKEKLK
jgi:phosphoglycerol geranylgeranyltransferase